MGTTKAEGHAKLSVRRLVRTWDDDSLGCKLGLPENKAGQPLEGETQTPPGVKDEAQLSHRPGKVALKDAKKGKKKTIYGCTTGKADEMRDEQERMRIRRIRKQR